MQFYTVRGAAEVASCHPQTIADAVRGGELHGTQKATGKHWKIEDSCLRAWILGQPCEHRPALGVAA